MEQEHIRIISELHSKFYDAMIKYALRRTGVPEIAQDMVQEVFQLAVLKINELAEHPNPAGWLFKALHYTITREMELTHYHEEISLEELPLSTPDNSHTPGLDEYLPEDLSESEREILILKFEKQLKYTEMAEILGIKPSACRKRLSRATAHLKKILENEQKMSQNGLLNGYISRGVN